MGANQDCIVISAPVVLSIFSILLTDFIHATGAKGPNMVGWYFAIQQVQKNNSVTEIFLKCSVLYWWLLCCVNFPLSAFVLFLCKTKHLKKPSALRNSHNIFCQLSLNVSSVVKLSHTYKMVWRLGRKLQPMTLGRYEWICAISPIVISSNPITICGLGWVHQH